MGAGELNRLFPPPLSPQPPGSPPGGFSIGGIRWARQKERRVSGDIANLSQRLHHMFRYIRSGTNRSAERAPKKLKLANVGGLAVFRFALARLAEYAAAYLTTSRFFSSACWASGKNTSSNSGNRCASFIGWLQLG